MPTYEYECDRCSHRFEEFQPITAAPLSQCPACRKKALRRLLGAGAGVIFKGSGFYQTDYRSESYKKAADADKPASAVSEQKADAKPSASATEATSAPASSPSVTPSKPSAVNRGRGGRGRGARKG